jgi:heptosyltransferase-2
VHAARWYCSAIPEHGGEPEPPPLRATEAEEAQAAPWRERLPPDFIAIHPGSGSPSKNWPADRFAAVARALSPHRPWLLIAGPADAAAVAPLAQRPGAIVARDLPLRVLGALLARARLYIGNDSGITHLAAAYGAPTLALFGPTDPAQWSPVGPQVKVLRAPHAAMHDLPVHEVLNAARIP